MGRITLSREEVFDAFDDGEVVKTEPWKWGTIRTVVFERDGKHYMFEVELHTEEGLQVFGDTDAYEVELRTKTTQEWERV